MNSDGQPPHRVVPPSRRRDKPVLSCSLCRRRKLKCDRQQPCQSCVQRGLSLACTYVQRDVGHGSKAAPESVHDRIDQLERLVTALMEGKRNVHSSSPAVSSPFLPLDEDNSTKEIGGTPDRVNLGDDATSYESSGHWTNILDGITELREELDRIAATEKQVDRAEVDISGPDLLFGRQRHLTKSEILAAVPPRSEADELVITYFASMDMAPIALHRPSFMQEYNRFWERPFDTPVMWLGLLFSIFATATRFRVVLDNPDRLCTHAEFSLYSARMDLYREKAVHCLILANYSNCPPYTIEALLLYFVTEYFRFQDAQFGIYVLVAIIVRLAFRMGYHREPSRFPNISVFQGEMRRRAWVMIVQLDLITSTQFGLPRMIQPSMYDVKEPRILNEEDLNPDMGELPPSRSGSEPTLMLYVLVRNRLLQLFSRITDLTASLTHPPHSEVLKLDQEIQIMHENLPPSVRAISVRDFDNADSTHAMWGLFLGLSFLRAKLMVHRPFLLLGRADARFQYSRITCLTTALELLEFQRKLDIESRPGGRLWTVKWRLWSSSWRFSSIVNHDFLLATTVLSVDLDKDLTSTSPVSPSAGQSLELGSPTQAEIVTALTNAYTIWKGQSEHSREARKAAAAVRLVLRKASVNVDDDGIRGNWATESYLNRFSPVDITGLFPPQGDPQFQSQLFNSDYISFANLDFTQSLFPDATGKLPGTDWTLMNPGLGPI
ncbi:uncharacterized protein EI97DRAFT_432150 [Westerdykella ornata]|uniref:Zn(2)-C6 fungal-type domain-containing protein n=1 Tax=Westerdykella ornata TaxID=318751 RepID=A0A6A6JP82_WESOR|nr:uncharacterized protein EI97DRAFT_432150 [Westerdykella ornata]KAF2278074.1 hypothetical protein EI97DRAFT_432150 [Westerdykella ornata]